MTIKTKWFASTFTGAPACTGQVGQLLAVLNACLVDGFNLMTLDSLVVAGNEATGTKAGHGFKEYQVIEVAGATPAGLNGEWRVTAVTSNTFKFTTAGIADQAASGTITAKTPGAGWAKQFTGTNQAVFKSQSAYSAQQAVRLTDTGTTDATLVGAESWTDISTAVNSFATQSIKKSSSADGTARAWVLIADDRGIYFGVAWTGTTSFDFSHFGDFDSLVYGDAAAFQMRCAASVPGALGGYSSLSDAMVADTVNTGVAPRSYSQVFGATAISQASMAGALYAPPPSSTLYTTRQLVFSGAHGFGQSTTPWYSLLSTDLYAAPNPCDGGLHFFPVFLFEGPDGSKRLRGTARGLLHVIESLPSVSGDFQLLTGIENTVGGIVLLIRSVGERYGYGTNRVQVPTVIAFSLGDW